MRMIERLCLVLGVLVAAEAHSEVNEQESRDAQQHPHQLSWEASLAKGDFALQVDDREFTFRGDTGSMPQAWMTSRGA